MESILNQLQSVVRLVESVRNLVKGDQGLQVNIRNGLEDIKYELALLSADVKTISEGSNQDRPQEWILHLQELAYSIEDFMDERGRDPKTSAPVRLVQAALLMDPRPEHLSRINHFKDLIKRIRDYNGSPSAAATTRPPRSNQQSSGTNGLVTPVAGTPLAPSRSMSPPNISPMAAAPMLVGMDQPKRELTDLLLGTTGGHEDDLKVISIIGCSGLGKTTLAWALFDDPYVGHQFPHRAWIEASSPDHVKSTLQSVCQQVRCPQGVDGQASDLHKFLRDKRYLIVIDGVQQREVWAAMRQAFPENKQRSRVVVTTSIRSVATCCSYGSYLYAMPRLENTDPADLLWAKLGRPDRPPALKEGLKTFFHKSDGLPRVIASTGEYLSSFGADLKAEDCEDVGKTLGNLLAGEEPAFGEIRRELKRCCDSLPEYGHKMCMLSLSSYPKGHPIKRKSLMRRWIAEGFVGRDVQLDKEKISRDCLNRMLDLGIVEPAPLGSSSKVKRCQVHGVMLEFLVHRSVSWNFITLIQEGRLVSSATTVARRLSIHGHGDMDRDDQEIDPSHIRSLTACNTGDLRGTLEMCKLLRVLDLESCGWLGNGHLAVICGLLHLKYLNLRNTQVSELPKAVGDLHCLETLDVRGTEVDKVPMEVLMLPQLAHLFGRFELPAELENAKKADKLKEFLSKKSKLRTIAGFKIVNKRGFEHILQHSGMLRKVKIWCEVPPPDLNPPKKGKFRAFKRSLQNSLGFRKMMRSSNVVSSPDGSASFLDTLVSSLVTRFTGSNALDTLSIHFGGRCKNFLASVLKDPCAVRYIKVWGEMEGLPDSQALSKLHRVKELHLCNTGLHSEVLSVLQSLNCLESLKLAEDREGFWEGSFLVEANGFPSLKQLCFDGPKLPNVEFRPGSMSALISLQLICLPPANDELGVTGIMNLRRLNEVILHPQFPDAKMDAWKREAVNHWNRPYVKKQSNSNAS